MKVDRNSETWLSIEALAAEHEQLALVGLRSKASDLPTTQYFRGVLDFIEALRNIEQQSVRPVIPTGPAYEPATGF